MNEGSCPCHSGTKAQRLFGACDPITGNRFEIVECAECGLARTAPQLSPDELDRYYPRPITVHPSGTGCTWTGACHWSIELESNASSE